MIGAAIRVHRALGPGLLESAYQESLAAALQRAGIPLERGFPVPTFFEDCLLATHYRLDSRVGGYLELELRAVEALHPFITPNC